jgi:replicative DNA helicase
MSYNHGLYDTSSENFIIGALLNNPTLVHNELYLVTASDFFNKRNQIIFSVIFNMASQGVERITPQDVDSYLMRFPEQYRVYNENSGINALMAVSEIGNPDLKIYELNLNRIKKFTILRDLESIGINTKRFYDKDALFNSDINERFESLTIEELVNTIKKDLNDIEDKHVSKKKATVKDASEGIASLIEQFKEAPEVGEFLDGDIYNYAVRGARFGKFYLNSAASGHGKTRIMVGHSASLAFPRITPEGKLITKPEYHKVLFVATEQDASEIQTLLLANISGVDEGKILLGSFDKAEEKRLRQAAAIIEKYAGNFTIEWIPDPSIALVRTKIVKHIYKNDIRFVFYDYIFSSPALLAEYSSLRIREDVALMMLSNTLKEIAVEHQIFMMSSTQLNSEWQKQSVRNANMIRGSRAVVDKVDVGSISIKLDIEEYEKVQSFAESGNYKYKPNMVTDVYKNRRGSLTEIKIFRYFDYATCRVYDLFMTDQNYNIRHDYEFLKDDKQLIEVEEFLNGN